MLLWRFSFPKMLFPGNVRVVLHVRGSVFAVCVLVRLLVSDPVQASLNDTWVDEFRDEPGSLSDLASDFLFRGDWDYGKERGPANWPGFCTTGKKQSPVRLEEDDADLGYAERLAFFNYENPAPLKLVNNGHSVSASVTENCPRAVGAGKLPGLYYLDSFHFHWKSEHTINGEQFPLELHLVHVHQKYRSVNEAMRDSVGLAVVGVLFRVSAEDNPGLTPLLEGVKKVASAVESSADVSGFVLKELLPNARRFYRYPGSLTTPDCNEIVVWTVLETPLHISSSQLQVFHEVQDANKKTLVRNFRPVQPLGDRDVYLYRAGASRTRGVLASLMASLSLFL